MLKGLNLTHQIQLITRMNKGKSKICRERTPEKLYDWIDSYSIKDNKLGEVEVKKEKEDKCRKAEAEEAKANKQKEDDCQEAKVE